MLLTSWLWNWSDRAAVRRADSPRTRRRLRRHEPRRWMAPHVEPLEQRLALTTISLNGSGDLLIESFGFANDELSIHADGPNNQFVISDLGQILNTGISGATGSGTNQVFLPFSSVSNAKQLIVNTSDGNDVIRLTASNGFAFDLAPVLDGGDGIDAIELNAAVSVATDDVAVMFISEDIRLGGDITTAGGTITFQGNVFVTHDVSLLTDGATTDGDVEFFGQVDSSVGPSTYTLMTTPLSYEQARMQAGGDVPGGYLVTIRSAAEQADVQALAGTNSVWLGASDLEVEGQWFWESGPDFGVQFWNGDGTTGSAVGGEVTNWLPGEPDNIDGTAEGDAAFLEGSDSQGRWRDGDPTVSRPYIVEAPSLFALSISAGGALVKLDGPVGNSLPLRSLAVNAAQTRLNGGSVRTAEAQTFNSTVSLMGQTQLLAGDVNFGGGANSVIVSSELPTGLTLAPIRVAAPITVGAATDAGPASFDITDTDIAALTSGLLKVAIGEFSPAGSELPGSQSRSLGPVTVTSATFLSPVSISGGSISVTGLDVGTLTVELTAVIGTITDGGGGAADVTANELLMDSSAGIGTSSDPLDLAVGAIAARTMDGGGVFLANTGNLVIGPTFAPGGIMANNDVVSVSSTGSITVNQMIFSAGGDVSLTAAEGITINGVPVDTAGGQFFADADSNNDGLGTFTLGSITEFVNWMSPTQGTLPGDTTVEITTSSLATATAQDGVNDTRFSDGNIYLPPQASGEFVETRFEGQGEFVTFSFSKSQFGLFLHFDGMQYQGTPFDPVDDNPINLYSFDGSIFKVSGESTWDVDRDSGAIRQLSGGHLADQDGTVLFDGVTSSLTLFRQADGVSPGNGSIVNVQLGLFRAGVLFTGGEAITIRAADVILDGMIDANTGLVTLIPSGTNRTVDLGSEEGSGLFVLTDQELDRISTTNGLVVGDTSTGTITINGTITRLAATTFTLTVADGQDIVFSGPNAMLNTNGGSVTLTTGGTGAILSGGAVDDLRASAISLNAGSGGLGESGNPLALNADTLATATSDNGDQFLSEVNDLTVGTTGLNAGSGIITLDNGAFRLGGPNRIGDATTLSIGPSAALQLNGFGETLGGLSDSGSVFNGSTTASGLTINGSGDSEFSGLLGGFTANDNNFSLTKSGIGRFTLSGVSTFLGTTTVNGGTLIINGSTTSATTVAAEATLGGSGTINGSVTVNNGGTVAPGNSPGILNTGDLAFSGGSAGALSVSSYVTEAAGTGATVNPDSGGVELTDGLFVTDGAFGFGDVAYVNYRDDGGDDGLGQPRVLFDLGDTFALSTVSIRYLHSTGAGSQAAGTITAPEQALVSVSNDGTTFSTPVAFTSQFNSSAGNAIRTAVLDLTGMTGRFVRVDIRQSQQHTFIDEISFTGGPPAPVFAAEVNDAIPGTGHDQINVTGTVNLGGATLSASGTVTSSPGQSIVLINNDGTDPISGTFAGLAEGATVTINSANFVLSYRGGTGNDVTLTEAGTLTFQGTRFNDAIELREETISGSDYLQLLLGGTLLEQRLTSSVTDVMISGGDGNDALTINYGGSGGFFNKPVTFNGQNPIGGTGDSLVLTGGSFTTITHVFTNASDGSVEIDGTTLVAYTGLEPITDNLSATDRVFTFNGGAETITLTDAAGANMTIDSDLSESVTFANPTGSLTINAGTGNDVVTITSMDTAFNRHLTINGDGGNDTINLNGDITFGADQNLNVDLQNDATSGDVDLIQVGTNANLLLSGTGAATLQASRNISLASGSSVTTVDGNLTVNANQQTTATSGNFVGIDVNAAVVQATGTGIVNVQGKGGAGASGTQFGVQVRNGGTISGGATGASTVITGTGGAGSGGVNYGAVVVGAGSRITSGGGNVSVTGNAGAAGGDNRGIEVMGGGQVTSGGSGTVTVTGTGGGGAGAGIFHIGVHVRESSTITSGGGNVTVTGTGGGAGTSSNNFGVLVASAGQIAAGGSATVTVTGTGGLGSNGSNQGVVVTGASSRITSGSGNVSVTGVEGGGASSIAINIASSGAITTATNGGTATVIGNSMNFDNTAVISAQSGSSVTLRQNSNNVGINLGSATDPIGGPLSLVDAELDRVTAGTINIGDANSGAITFSNDITRSAATQIVLMNGGANNLIFSGATAALNAGGGDVTIVVGVAVISGGATTEITADDLSITTGGGGIAAPANPLTLSVNTLVTSAAGNQNFAEADSLTIGAADLSSGDVRLVSGTFLTSATGSILSDVIVFNGATLGGTGTTGAVSTQSGGNISPGNSPGVLNSGSVTLVSSSNFNVEIDGTAGAGAVGGHDQLNVNGTVALGGANLVLMLGGSYTPANGDSFVIVNNDGTDAVTETFFVGGSSIPDGGAFTISGTRFIIDYTSGSDSNDVTLTVQNSTLAASIVGNDLVIEDIDGTGKNNLLTVSRSGSNLVITDVNEPIGTAISGAVFSNGNKTVSVPASALGVGGKIIVKTLGGNDSLSVDVSTDLGFDVDYQGGLGTNDSLTLAADTVTSVTHAFTNANDGSVTIVDGSTRVISYTGLEPITDNLSATDRVFNFGGSADTITLTDATGSAMTIDSPNSESVTFANPSGSLTINAGAGNDAVQILSVDANFLAALTINGGVGTDTATLDTNLTLGAGAVIGSVLITAETINLNANISTDLGTNAGSIVLNGAVELGVNVTLDSNSTNGTDANITFGDTIDGARNLTTNSGGAATTFSGAIGNATALTDLDVAAGTINLNANVTTDGGSLTFAGNTVLGADVIIDTEAGNDNSAGSVAFSGGSLSATGANRNLTLNTLAEGGNNGGSVTLAAVGNAAGNSIQLLSISALSLGAGSGGDVTFTNAVNLASDGGLFVEGRTISLSTANSDLTLSGTGSAFLRAARNIDLVSGSSIQAVDGDVALFANQAAIPTTGNFTSIQLDQATIRTTGSGSISLLGRSGDAGNLQYGILLQNSSLLEATGTGQIELIGESRGTGGPENDGMLIASSSDILSNSGQIILRGVRGVGGTSEGIGLTDSGITISATSAPIFLLSDVIHIGQTQPVISAGGGNVIALRPITPGTAIGLGAASSSDFSLSDAQLDRLTADAIEIGGSDSGTITISNNITRPSATSISLITGGDNNIDFSGPNATLDSNNGEVTLFLNPEGTGAITSGGALKDVKGLDVFLTSGSGGIGTDANPLITDASSLFLETSGNADAFLSEIDSLTISSDGLSADFGRIVFASGLFRLGGAERLDDDSSLLVKSGAVLQLNGFNETVAAIAGGGAIINGTAISANLNVSVGSDTTSTFAGVLGGATANDRNFGLTSLGLGTLVLSGSNTFTGPLNVDAGKLLINGSVTADANIASGAVLGGTGSLGGLNVSAGGTVAPGTSPGILNTSNLTLQPDSNFEVELEGTIPGTGYDQINVTGTVTVNGLLNASLSFLPTVGDTFVIIRNDGSDAVSGNFSDLTQGSLLTIGETSFHIVYDFNSGDGNRNDVALIVNRPPVILAQSFAVDEDAIRGDVVGTVVATDAESAVTFAITAGDPAGIFTINRDSGLIVISDETGLADVNQFVLTVEATDDAGATKLAFITINVLGPAPTAPSDADGTNSNRNDGFAPEGALPGTRVGITLSATDLQGGAVFYRLTDDAGGRFTVDPLTGVVTVKTGHLLNFADATEHTIRAQAVDADGNPSPEMTFGIDVVEVPVNALPLASILPSRVSIVEGDPDDPGHRFISFLVKLNKPSTETVQIDFSTRVGEEPGFLRPDGIPADASFATDIVGQWDFFRSSGRLLFDPGVTEQTVRVQLRPDDDATEVNELFFVQLDSPVNAQLAAGQSIAVAEILEDDSVPQVIVENAQVLEGAAPGQKELVFRLRLVGDFALGLTSATVDFATDDLPIDTATADVDYTSASGTLTFTEGSREQEVRIPITGDVDDETDETLSLRFTNAVGLGLSRNFAVGTIINDDSADVVVSITPLVSKVREGQDGTQQVELFVTLIGQPTTDVSVNYTTEDHQAIAGSDYVAVSGTVTFTLDDIAAGLTRKSIVITVNGDTDIELDEGFAVSLSLPTPLPDVSLDPSNLLSRVVIRNDDQAVLTEDADELFADLLTDLVDLLEVGGGAKNNPALLAEMQQRAVQIARSLGLTRAIILIIDPVDFVLTDPGDRQSGYTENSGSINQIPGTYYSGDGAVELLIIPLPPDGTYNVQLAGLGGDFNASVTIVDGDRSTSGVVSDFSGQFFQVGDLAVQFGEGRIPIGLGLAAANTGAAASAVGVVGDFGHAEFRLALASALEQARTEGLNPDDADSRATGLMFWLSVSARVLRQRFIEPLWQSLGSPLDGLLSEGGFTRIAVPSELVDHFWSQVGQTLTGVPSGIYRLGNMLESVIPTLMPRRVRSAPPQSGDQGQPNSAPGNNGVKTRRSSLERPRVAPPNGQAQPPSKPNATKDKSAQTPDSKKLDGQQSSTSHTRWLWFTFKDEKSAKPTERRGA